ncbi:MAG: 30S ribosomal protein S20 [Rickettsiales bacterium]|nr:30S ribosomal protein S20 [Rickettsiales bacterium]
MANTKSAKKELRASARRNEVNSMRKGRIRTFIKKVESAIKDSNKSSALEAFKALEPEIMRGVTKRVFKLNSAARKLRRLSASIKNIDESKAKKAETKKKDPAKKVAGKKATAK